MSFFNNINVMKVLGYGSIGIGVLMLFGIITDCNIKQHDQFQESVRACIEQRCSVVSGECLCGLNQESIR